MHVFGALFLKKSKCVFISSSWYEYYSERNEMPGYSIIWFTCNVVCIFGFLIESQHNHIPTNEHKAKVRENARNKKKYQSAPRTETEREDTFHLLSEWCFDFVFFFAHFLFEILLIWRKKNEFLDFDFLEAPK